MEQNTAIHSLALAISKSGEYRNFMAVKNEILINPQYAKTLENFNEKQRQIFEGKGDLNALNDDYDKLMQNKVFQNYFSSFEQLNELLSESFMQLHSELKL